MSPVHGSIATTMPPRAPRSGDRFAKRFLGLRLKGRVDGERNVTTRRSPLRIAANPQLSTPCVSLDRDAMRQSHAANRPPAPRCRVRLCRRCSRSPPAGRRAADGGRCGVARRARQLPARPRSRTCWARSGVTQRARKKKDCRSRIRSASFCRFHPRIGASFVSRHIDVVDRGGDRVDGGRLDGERELCSRGIDDGAASGCEFDNASGLIFSARDAALVHAEVGGPNAQNGKGNEEQYACDPDPSERDLHACRSHGRGSLPDGASAIT